MFGGAMAVEPRRGHNPRLHPQSPQVTTTGRSSNIDYTKSETRLYQVNVHIGSNILYNIAATYYKQSLLPDTWFEFASLPVASVMVQHLYGR